LAERLAKAKQRVLQGMSDEELEAKIRELQTQLETRHPKFDLQFIGSPEEQQDAIGIPKRPFCVACAVTDL
jgi:hypothetical protein